jgi:hypothetical protein
MFYENETHVAHGDPSGLATRVAVRTRTCRLSQQVLFNLEHTRAFEPLLDVV